MIVYPEDWDYIYHIPTLDEIEGVLFSAVKDTKCCNLCLSDGVDSSLTLHFMSQIYDNIKCFTIAHTENHPDVFYSRMMTEKYGIDHFVYIPSDNDIKLATKQNDLDGDVAVRLLFKFISNEVESAIVTDCIDELDCGYYVHQSNPDDNTFRRIIKELEDNHLRPLDINSGNVRVYVPYATKDVVNTFLRIPVVDKTIGRKFHIRAIANKYIPLEIIDRWKYGFCDAFRIKT